MASKKKLLFSSNNNKSIADINTSIILSISDRATKRVIAPYVSIIRKGLKPTPKALKKGPSLTNLIGKKPSVLMRKISEFLYDNVDLTALLRDTANCLKSITAASGVHLYIIDNDTEEIYFSSTRLKFTRHKVSWKINKTSTIAAYVAATKEYVLLDDILEDNRFPEGLGYKDDTIKSVLCVPVIKPNDECYAVVELYRDTFQPSFMENDMDIVSIVCSWMGAAIHQNQQRLALQKQQELNDYLIELCKCYFSNSITLDKLLNEIVSFSKNLLDAERGTFYTVDKEKDELIADIQEEASDDELDTQPTKPLRISFNRNRGIAGTVARTGVMLNIKDAYNDPRFNREIDDKTGFITRSILCMPIKDQEGILGVVQVINKKDRHCFTKIDEMLFKTFTTYFALALHFSKLNYNIQRKIQFNNITLELLQFHIKPCFHDVRYFSQNTYLDKIPSRIVEFDWHFQTNDDMKLMPFLFYIMTDIIGEEEFDLHVFRKFLLCVKKCYRDLAYHNFKHGFYFTHCMYCIIKRNMDIFKPMEIKSLMIASICHDVEHFGLTNQFLKTSGHYLARLYEQSFLENYHYYITTLILNKYKIFPKFTEEEYVEFLEGIKNTILGTDLSLYFAYRSKLQSIFLNNKFDWNDSDCRCMVFRIMSIACDVSYQLKAFHVTQKYVDALYDEFYHEGDLEKSMGLEPLSIKDRTKPFAVPLDQIIFLNVVVLPCAKLIKLIFPNTMDYYVKCNSIKNNWIEIIRVKGQKIWMHEDSIVK